MLEKRTERGADHREKVFSGESHVVKQRGRSKALICQNKGSCTHECASRKSQEKAPRDGRLRAVCKMVSQGFSSGKEGAVIRAQRANQETPPTDAGPA